MTQSVVIFHFFVTTVIAEPTCWVWNGNHRMISVIIETANGVLAPNTIVGCGLKGKPLTAVELLDLYKARCLATANCNFRGLPWFDETKVLTLLGEGVDCNKLLSDGGIMFDRHCGPGLNEMKCDFGYGCTSAEDFIEARIPPGDGIVGPCVNDVPGDGISAKKVRCGNKIFSCPKPAAGALGALLAGCDVATRYKYYRDNDCNMLTPTPLTEACAESFFNCITFGMAPDPRAPVNQYVDGVLDEYYYGCTGNFEPSSIENFCNYFLGETILGIMQGFGNLIEVTTGCKATSENQYVPGIAWAGYQSTVRCHIPHSTLIKYDEMLKNYQSCLANAEYNSIGDECEQACLCAQTYQTEEAELMKEYVQWLEAQPPCQPPADGIHVDFRKSPVGD